MKYNQILTFLKVLSVLVILSFFIGCSQKIVLKTLVPSAIDDKDIKNVSIETFTGDSVSLKDNISSLMNSIHFNDKQYFNIVNRKDIDKILDEQKLQDSGLVDGKVNTRYTLGNVASIINGNVNSKTHQKSIYFETKTNYNQCLKYSDDKKTCVRYQKYRVHCDTHTYNLSANINVTKLSNSKIIFTKLFNSDYEINICEDENRALFSEQVVFENLSRNISEQFVSIISPTYKNISLELIEDEDIKYNDNQIKLLNNALKLIQLKDIVSANKLLVELVLSTQYKSSTALYNLGITYEYLNDYEKAFEAYQNAKAITILDDVNELIIHSAHRIKEVISNRNKAIKQINN